MEPTEELKAHLERRLSRGGTVHESSVNDSGSIDVVSSQQVSFQWPGDDEEDKAGKVSEKEYARTSKKVHQGCISSQSLAEEMTNISLHSPEDTNKKSNVAAPDVNGRRRSSFQDAMQTFVKGEEENIRQRGANLPLQPVTASGWGFLAATFLSDDGDNSEGEKSQNEEEETLGWDSFDSFLSSGMSLLSPEKEEIPKEKVISANSVEQHKVKMKAAPVHVSIKEEKSEKKENVQFRKTLQRRSSAVAIPVHVPSKNDGRMTDSQAMEVTALQVQLRRAVARNERLQDRIQDLELAMDLSFHAVESDVGEEDGDDNGGLNLSGVTFDEEHTAIKVNGENTKELKTLRLQNQQLKTEIKRLEAEATARSASPLLDRENNFPPSPHWGHKLPSSLSADHIPEAMAAQTNLKKLKDERDSYRRESDAFQQMVVRIEQERQSEIEDLREERDAATSKVNVLESRIKHLEAQVEMLSGVDPSRSITPSALNDLEDAEEDLMTSVLSIFAGESANTAANTNNKGGVMQKSESSNNQTMMI